MTEKQSRAKNDGEAMAMPQARQTEALAEYAALRNEIVKRIEIRHQLLVLMLAAFGILLPLGVEKEVVEALLIYPLLVLCMAFEWMHIDVRIGEMGEYIKYHMEARPFPPHGYPFWETYLEGKRRDEYNGAKTHATVPTAKSLRERLQSPWAGVKRVVRRLISKATETSAAGLLGLTGVAAVVLALPRLGTSAQSKWILAVYWVLVLLDGVAITWTVWILGCRRRKYYKQRGSESPSESGTSDTSG